MSFSFQETPDLLTDVEQQLLHEPATAGQRLANYLVDLVLFYLFAALLFAALVLIAPDTMGPVLETENNGSNLSWTIGVYLLYIGYYALLEGLTKGRTLGKLITKTKVVTEDFDQPGLSAAFTRSLCRIVPFEPFSALGGKPWHDKWSKTMVVKNRRHL